MDREAHTLYMLLSGVRGREGGSMQRGEKRELWVETRIVVRAGVGRAVLENASVHQETIVTRARE